MGGPSQRSSWSPYIFSRATTPETKKPENRSAVPFFSREFGTKEHTDLDPTHEPTSAKRHPDPMDPPQSRDTAARGGGGGGGGVDT